MSMTLAEIKDLISFGHELGLQQLQTDGVVVVYGAKSFISEQHPVEIDDATSVLAHYSAMGRQAMGNPDR